MSEPKVPFVRRVVLRNYKSIRECDVALGPLSLLVGPNGSGKSNFLDALRFVAEALRYDLQYAAAEREEVRKIFHRSPAGGSTSFSIELELNLPDRGEAFYTVTVGQSQGVPEIQEEICRVGSEAAPRAYYHAKDGHIIKPSSISTPPLATRDQLYLRTVSGIPEFQTLYHLLKGMSFFNFDPEQIKADLSSGKPARELMRTGRGALFAFHRLHSEAANRIARLEDYLRAILPTFLRVIEVPEGIPLTDRGRMLPPAFPAQILEASDEPRSLLFEFRAGSRNDTPYPQRFGARNLSDGTLRSFGILLALFQCADRPASDPIPVVGIEEPEAAIHPAAAGVLMDALGEASHFTQVLVTTHSPDLLDSPDLDEELLLLVDMIDGKTVIDHADDASKSIMRDRLSTAGELLRQNQLTPLIGQLPGPLPADAERQ